MGHYKHPFNIHMKSCNMFLSNYNRHYLMNNCTIDDKFLIIPKSLFDFVNYKFLTILIDEFYDIEETEEDENIIVNDGHGQLFSLNYYDIINYISEWRGKRIDLILNEG